MDIEISTKSMGFVFTISKFLFFKMATDLISIENFRPAEIRQWPVLQKFYDRNDSTIAEPLL